ncbi:MULTISPECIES: DnaJ domain-containing protein [Cyanophyceae]|uniref:J domain-containing protein n=1 Tax=Cyanophyceae TaxID=3028117 RepID=UPI001683DEF3|nr:MULTISPECIES: DnaJ domain-containing protein [Cyanophyceae]MBD1916544.1 DnaJ domain-containing protein [Phormidium sp. FACHB-77]MBD2032111.1 DnaJ domain-containing protein [Phormidium sp. FACHB-322]MBD2052991.1 DnaJ domain-containing protein [Leptolyngbya sp. FACHB-60]
MALAHYYRILGLRTGASFGDVKLAYRNLARLYHPDINPGDHLAKEKFIQVTQAYQALVNELPVEAIAAQRKATPSPATKAPAQTTPIAAARPSVPAVSPPAKEVELTVSPTPGGSEADQQLKVNSFKQLRELFKGQRFPRAVALVEGLVQRFPEDPEIRQWHAITYYRWGHDLLNHGNLKKAEACLKKARRVDPQNRSLRQALHHDFQRLEQLRQAPVPQAQ